MQTRSEHRVLDDDAQCQEEEEERQETARFIWPTAKEGEKQTQNEEIVLPHLGWLDLTTTRGRKTVLLSITKHR